MSQFQLGIPDIPRVTDVAIVPPVADNAALFESVQRSLGLIGRGAGIIAQIGRIQSMERSRDAAEARREQRALEVTQRALGVSNADFDISSDRDAILAGTLMPQEDESVDEFTERVLDSRTRGLPEETKKGYRRNHGPKFKAAVIAKLRADRNEQLDEIIVANKQGAIRATTADEIREHMEAVATMNPDMSELDVLREVVLPALKSAAQVGDGIVNEEGEIIGGRMAIALEVLGENFPEVQREQMLVFQARRDAIRREAGADMVAEFQMLMQSEPTNREVKDFLDDARGSMERGEIHKKVFADIEGVVQTFEQDRQDSLQEANFSQFEELVEFGGLPLEEGETVAEATERIAGAFTQLPEDNPKHLTTEQFDSLRRRAERKTKEGVSTIKVQRRMGGDPNTVLNNEDSPAVMEWMVTNGAVSAEGTILNPDLVAGTVLESGIMPEELKSIITQHLLDHNIDNAINGALVVARLQRQKENAYSNMVSKLDNGLHAMYEAAAIELRRGRLESNDPTQRTVAINNIRSARELGTASVRSGAESSGAMKLAGIDLTSEVNDTITEYTQELNHARDTIRDNGIFFLDPSLNLANTQVLEQVGKWLQQKYDILTQVSGLDSETAMKNARVYAVHRLHEEYVAVRFEDSITLFRKPRDFEKGHTWSEGMEEDALNDPMVKNHPDRDTIASIVPISGFDLPEDEKGRKQAAGYVFYDGQGNRLRNPRTGNLLVYTPDPKFMKENEKKQDGIDKRIANFRGKPSFGEAIKRGDQPGLVDFAPLNKPTTAAGSFTIFQPSAVGFDPLARFRNPEQIRRQEAMRKILRERKATRRLKQQQIERDRFTRGSIP